MYGLKKVISVILIIILVVTISACNRKNSLINNEVPIAEQNNFSIIGEWTVANIDTKRTEDDLKKAISGLLTEYFEEGTTIEFKDDNTAIYNEEPLTYKIEGDELRLERDDKTKNFILKLEGNNSALEFSSNDIVFITLTRN